MIVEWFFLDWIRQLAGAHSDQLQQNEYGGEDFAVLEARFARQLEAQQILEDGDENQEICAPHEPMQGLALIIRVQVHAYANNDAEIRIAYVDEEQWAKYAKPVGHHVRKDMIKCSRYLERQHYGEHQQAAEIYQYLELS